MGRATALTASCALLASTMLASVALSAPPSPALNVGDVLKYDIAIELQVHVAPAPHTTQPPLSVDTSVLGTETITVLRNDRDGSVHASANVAVRASGAGQTRGLIRTMLVKVSPDGSMQVESGGDAAMTQYVKAIGDAAKLFRARTLHVGDTFSQTVSVPGIVPVKVTSQAKVVGQQMYRGYPTFAVESTGSGNFDDNIAGMRATGTVNVAGTTYVDQRDRLFIGQAVRSDVAAMVAGPQGNRVTAVATINIVLDSFTHGVHVKRAPAAPTAAPSATPGASPTPSPTPTPYGQYYTPTPPAPTPSPVVTSYPPLPL